MNHRLWPAVAMATVLASQGLSQTPPPAAEKAQGAPTTPAPAQKPAPKPGELKPYEDVVTKEAKTSEGVFKVHRIEDKILWEIPKALLGREFLWQTEVAELAQNAGYPGTATGAKLVRFERRNNKLFLRIPSYAMRDDSGALEAGIKMNSLEPIVQAWDIQAEGPAKDTVVVDVTAYFVSDPADFSIKGAVGGAGADPSRSYVDSVRTFPTNVETRVLLTFSKGASRGNPFGGGGSGGPDATATTALAHHSLVLLPEVPMQGRLKDSRIGYFTVGFDQFGKNDNRVVSLEYISRFKLEKKDPTAAVSEPVKPITFYLSREVPAKWRPYLKAGIESWQPAFEKAGFKNAIICKDAPTKEEDPTWDAEDVRYNVIRWAPSKIANAMGPSIQDPRSGETISAHVIFWHNILDLVQKWYFVQCAAIDPSAAKLPLSEKLTGELVRYVAAHEVGHTLGLEHNFRASVARSIKQLRDPLYMKTHGVSSSIMSYSRNNYVAQPGDGITYSSNGFLGEYDYFAIQYGYKPIPGVSTPFGEKPTLDKWLSRQITDHTVRFGNYKYGIDPTTQSENIGSDAVEATRLGFLNLERIAKTKLIPATTKPGEDFDFLAEVHGELTFHRLLWTLHVMEQVGGVIENDVHAGHGDTVFAPVPKEKQARAVRFLTTEGFASQSAIFSPAILNKIQPEGYNSSIQGYQSMVLRGLFNEGRLRRMLDNQALHSASTYTVKELITTVTGATWRGALAKAPVTSPASRALQLAYLDTLDTKLVGTGKTKTDARLYFRDTLKTLGTQIDQALTRKPDRLTAIHLQDCRKEIARILSGRATGNAAAGASNGGFFFGIKPTGTASELDCFSKNAQFRELARRYPELFR